MPIFFLISFFWHQARVVQWAHVHFTLTSVHRHHKLGLRELYYILSLTSSTCRSVSSRALHAHICSSTPQAGPSWTLLPLVSDIKHVSFSELTCTSRSHLFIDTTSWAFVNFLISCLWRRVRVVQWAHVHFTLAAVHWHHKLGLRELSYFLFLVSDVVYVFFSELTCALRLQLFIDTTSWAFVNFLISVSDIKHVFFSELTCTLRLQLFIDTTSWAFVNFLISCLWRRVRVLQW